MKSFLRTFVTSTLSLGFYCAAQANEVSSLNGTPSSVRITCDAALNLSSGEIKPAYRVETVFERHTPSPFTEARWRTGYNIRVGQKVLAVTSGAAKLYALEGDQVVLIAESRGLSGAHEAMEILPHSPEETQGRLSLNFDMTETGAEIPGGGRLLQLELWPRYERTENGEIKIATEKHQGSGMGIIKAYGNNPPMEDPYALVNCTRVELN